MDTDGVSLIIRSVVLVILLLLSALFSSAETALTTVNRLKLEALLEEGDKRAKRTVELLADSRKMLNAILILNNVVNLSASSLVTTIAYTIWGNGYIALATGVLTLVIILFGEIIPKTLASIYNEQFSLAYGGLFLFIIKAITPLVFIVDRLSALFLRMFRVDPKKAHTHMTEYELRSIVDVSHEEGVIESEEREMINNVVDFGDSCAKDIMIPRVEMCSVSVDAGYDELKSEFFEKKFTRIPVYEGSNDNIVGIINIKDIVFNEDREGFNIRSFMREANFTYEFKKTSDLLMEMRSNSISMIMVLDEYGATVGLITLEDLLEEIVGDIRDEFDEDEEDLIQNVGEREYLVDGSLKLDDINDALETDLKSTDYDSIGGLVIEKLEDIPEVGESVQLEDGTNLQVLEMDKNHIERVKLILPEPVSDPGDPEKEASEEATDDATA